MSGAKHRTWLLEAVDPNELGNLGRPKTARILDPGGERKESAEAEHDAPAPCDRLGADEIERRQQGVRTL
jgi:hypothetical protein